MNKLKSGGRRSQVLDKLKGSMHSKILELNEIGIQTDMGAERDKLMVTHAITLSPDEGFSL